MEGYDFEVFGSDVEEYRCPICMMSLKNPFLLPCNHTYCEECLEKWQCQQQQQQQQGIELSDLKCPLCNKAYQRKQVLNKGKSEDQRPHRMITTPIAVKCKQLKQGCRWTGPIYEYENHEKICDYKLLACPFKDCMEQIVKSALNDHKDVCLYRTVECQFCKSEITFSKQEAHFKKCSAHPVRCRNKHCQVTVPISELEMHRHIYCQYVEVLCPFYLLGCRRIEFKMNMKKHLDDEIFYHSVLLVQQISTFEKKINAINSTLSSNLSLEVQNSVARCMDRLGNLESETKLIEYNVEEAKQQIKKQKDCEMKQIIGPLEVEDLKSRIEYLEKCQKTPQKLEMPTILKTVMFVLAVLLLLESSTARYICIFLLIVCSFLYTL